MKNEQRGSHWREGSRRRIGTAAGSVGALALLAVLVGTVLALGAQGRATVAQLDDIVRQPDRYVGHEVAVGGVVEETLTHRALTVSDESSQRTLLVLVTEAALMSASDSAGGGLTGFVPQLHGPLYRDGAVVRLTGTMERFDLPSLAGRLNVVLNPELFSRYADKPVLIVDRLGLNDLIAMPNLDAPSPGG